VKRLFIICLLVRGWDLLYIILKYFAGADQLEYFGGTALESTRQRELCRVLYSLDSPRNRLRRPHRLPFVGAPPQTPPAGSTFAVSGKVIVPHSPCIPCSQVHRSPLPLHPLASPTAQVIVPHSPKTPYSREKSFRTLPPNPLLLTFPRGAEREVPLNALPNSQQKGRIADFRRKSEIERAGRRMLTLRASISLFCRANAAKVGSEPNGTFAPSATRISYGTAEVS
jgi:hypothetical protein